MRCYSLESHRHFLVLSCCLLLAARAWAGTLPRPVGGGPRGGGRGGVLEHGHEALVNCPPGLASLLKQEQDDGVLYEGRKHEENADHEIEINSIKTWGNRSLLPEITSWMFANNPLYTIIHVSPGRRSMINLAISRLRRGMTNCSVISIRELTLGWMQHIPVMHNVNIPSTEPYLRFLYITICKCRWENFVYCISCTLHELMVYLEQGNQIKSRSTQAAP